MAGTPRAFLKRVAALLLVLGTVYAARQGGVPGGRTGALAVGFALVAALLTGAVLRHFRLPRITGYLLFGLLCGPYVANIITRPMARELQAINTLAVGLVAFIAGLELDVSTLRTRLRQVLTVTGVTLVTCFLGLLAFLWLCWPWLPMAPQATGVTRFAMAAVTAALAVSFSPTVTAAVIADSRARGPLTDLVLAIVLVGDLILFIIFTLALQLARWSLGPIDEGAALMSRLGWELAGSFAYGALLGSLFAFYVRFVGRELTLLLLVLLIVTSYGGAALGFQPLLSAIAAGLVFANLARHEAERLSEAVQRGAVPVFVLFFAAAGASLELGAVVRLAWLVVPLLVLRVGLIRLGTGLSARRAGVPLEHGRRLWMCLLSQAGVTLALASIVATEFPSWGAPVLTLIVALMAVYEVIGPVLFKSALIASGDTQVAERPALLVVSNREPYMHSFSSDGRIVCPPAAGGVAVALDALMRERGGVWIAHGAGNADRIVVDAADHVAVPPDDPRYVLRRLWFKPEQYSRYYGGFANEGLWPLCHHVDVRPTFRQADWEGYQAVNAQFAAAIDEELTDPASPIFLNDYHVALVAKSLRERRPDVRTALFWHIPWPNQDRLRVCPMRRELLQGLLANDLVAFQLERDRRNFLLAVGDELDARVDVAEGVVYADNRRSHIVSVPIGVDFDRIQTVAADPSLHEEEERLRREFRLDAPLIGVGVDRLDYTKGIPERLDALDLLLRRRPDLRGRLTFVQVGVPSRSELGSYTAIEAEIDQRVADINARHTIEGGPTPIFYHKAALNIRSLVALYRLADVCVVSSLQDGMNLVAKEFVAARDDEGGVLVLSELAGAAEELRHAIMINPYNVEGFAVALQDAFEMSPTERSRRMHLMRRTVAGRNVFKWASDILESLDSLGAGATPRPRVPLEVAV